MWMFCCHEPYSIGNAEVSRSVEHCECRAVTKCSLPWNQSCYELFCTVNAEVSRTIQYRVSRVVTKCLVPWIQSCHELFSTVNSELSRTVQYRKCGAVNELLSTGNAELSLTVKYRECRSVTNCSVPWMQSCHELFSTINAELLMNCSVPWMQSCHELFSAVNSELSRTFQCRECRAVMNRSVPWIQWCYNSRLHSGRPGDGWVCTDADTCLREPAASTLSLLPGVSWIQVWARNLVSDLKREHRQRAIVISALRRISAGRADDMSGGWRKLRNEERHDLYTSPSITRIKSTRVLLSRRFETMSSE
jgi:hypothetical protein